MNALGPAAIPVEELQNRIVLPQEARFALEQKKSTHEIFHEAPPKPSMLTPGLDTDLEAVVLRLLARHPADRFQSARRVIVHLDTPGSGDCCPTYWTPLVAG